MFFGCQIKKATANNDQSVMLLTANLKSFTESKRHIVEVFQPTDPVKNPIGIPKPNLCSVIVIASNISCASAEKSRSSSPTSTEPSPCSLDEEILFDLKRTFMLTQAKHSTLIKAP